jgi:hypothetical protein
MSPKRNPGAFWRPLRGRDFVLLPLVSLLTVVAMLGGGEIAARIIWPMSLGVECQYGTPNGSRFRANCVSRYKAVDGPWVEDHFNDCGYRDAQSCKIAPEQLRVAVIGSSMARGHGAAYDTTFSARAAKMLGRRCNKPVDFQNLSTDVNDVPTLDHRVPEALKLKPSAILLLISSYDIQNVDAHPSTARQKQHLDFATLKHLFTSSRLVTVGQHYIYEDPAAQISVFLNTGSDDAHGYAVTPLPAKWEARVEKFGAIVDRGSAEARAANVPFILAYAPRRAQVLLDMPKYRRPNVDPLAIDRRLQQVAAADGAIFVDTTPSFAASPLYNSLFYIADGHPTAAGHAIIARDIVSTLLTLPAFAGCDRSPAPTPS